MNNSRNLPPETLDHWLVSAAERLNIDADSAPIGLILQVAADVAHGVTRPAAPLSTFLLGLALGQGVHGGASIEELAAILSELAEGWEDTVQAS